jgi:hypothetical protein
MNAPVSKHDRIILQLEQQRNQALTAAALAGALADELAAALDAANARIAELEGEQDGNRRTADAG